MPTDPPTSPSDSTGPSDDQPTPERRPDDSFLLAALTTAAALVGLLGLNAWLVGPTGEAGYLPVAADLTWLLAVGTAVLVAASRRL